jgi:hypothetical protein
MNLMTHTIACLSIAALAVISIACDSGMPEPASAPPASLLIEHPDPSIYVYYPALREATLKECQSGTPAQRAERTRLEACEYASDAAQGMQLPGS